MKAQVTINGVTFNVRACYELKEERFIREVIDVHFADNKPAERTRIAEKAWKMICKSFS